MAGSWKHFTDRNGRYDGSKLLENDGDVSEALVEAYGMVWYLANSLQEEVEKGTAAGLFTTGEHVEEARQRYKDGLKVSPGFTWNAADQNCNHDGAWGEHRAQRPEEDLD